MPIERCSLPNGKSGFRYGSSGKCYKDKMDAIRQMVAIKYFQEKGGEALAHILDEEPDLTDIEWIEAISNLPIVEQVTAYISKKERDKIPSEDFGDPKNRKYPIRNQNDLNAAVKLVGRAPVDRQSAIKEQIKRIAKRKGLQLPKTWQDG